MFGIAWSELLLIGIVALVVVPPKDLPVMMRTVGKWVGQMRRMANDFQNQVTVALREAEFDDIKKSVSDLTSIDAMADIRNEIESVTKPMTQLEGQMREQLSIPPEIKSFPTAEPQNRIEAAPVPSTQADAAIPPGHVAWPGAMEAASPAGDALPDHAADTVEPDVDRREVMTLSSLEPIAVHVSALPEKAKVTSEDEATAHQPNLASGTH